MAKKTQETFHQEVIDKYHLLPDGRLEYDPSEFEYLNCKHPSWLTHNKCGNRFEMKPNNFLSGQGCNNPDCMKEKIQSKNN